MKEWATIGKGGAGLLATITLERWNVVMATIAGTCTAIYMVNKVWKDVVKPRLHKRKEKHMRNKILGLLIVATLLIGCTVPVSVTQPDGSIKVEQKLDPRVESTLTTIGTVGGAVPQPWGWIVSAGAGIGLAVARSIAASKNKKSANQWEDVATTIIQGVEAAGDAAKDVKKSIAARAQSDGNGALVNSAVQNELRIN